MAENLKLETYKLAWENLRHYGELRFKILATFLVISGGLFSIALSSAERSLISFWFPCTGGVVMAIVFGLLEKRINEGMEGFAEATIALEKELQISEFERPQLERSKFTKALMPVMMWAVYGGAVAMWFAAGIYRHLY